MKLFCILIFALFFHPLNGMEITIPALPVSSPGTEAEASIVIDPEGNMTAVWSEQEVILVSDLPLHGIWSIPVFLSDALKSASSPKMEIDPAGNVTVLWQEENNIKAATRPFKGSWCISAMKPTFLPLRSEKSDEPTLSDSAPLNTVLALTPNGGGGGEAGDSKKSRSTGGTLRVKTAPQKESSSPDSPPTEKSPYLPMSSNAIDAPSGGVLSGLQMGFAAGTSAPTGGGIFSGSVGIGTSSVTNTLLNLVNTANPYTVQATGSMINVDGFSAQYGLTLQNGFNPTSGSALSADLAMLSAFIAPSGKTIASAAGVYVDLSAQSNVGIITNMYGVWVDNSFKSTGGTVTNNYGLYVSQPQGSATVTSTAYFDPAVGIGAVNPTTSSAALSITSTTQGFLEPVMTTTQQNAITSPATGLQIYNSSFEGPAFYNGSQWVQVGMQLIATVTVSVATATITFSSIPQTFHHLMLTGMARFDSTGGSTNNDDILIQFNSDTTTTNYWRQILQGNNGTVSAGAANDNILSQIPAASAIANCIGAFTSTIYEYSNANFFKILTTVTGYAASSTVNSNYFGFSNQWNNTSAITQIVLVCQTAGKKFVANSVFRLYGIN